MKIKVRIKGARDSRDEADTFLAIPRIIEPKNRYLQK